jgi:hypothetical protein
MMMMRTTTTTTNDNNTDNNNNTDTRIIVAVLGIRERFTHPMATTLGRAHTALLRLADLRDVTPNALKQSAARESLSHATVTALVLEAATAEAITAEACLREAVRLEAAYQDALLLLSSSSTSIVVVAAAAAELPPPLASYLGHSNNDTAADLVGYADALRDGNAPAVVGVAAQLVNALHMCAGTMELTPTTTRIVPPSEQAAYRVLWRAVCGGRDDDSPTAHPYGAAPTVALTTRAGSWLVHRGDLE